MSQAFKHVCLFPMYFNTVSDALSLYVSLGKFLKLE